MECPYTQPIDKVEYDASNERGTMLTLTKYRLLPRHRPPDRSRVEFSAGAR
jgi:hypothetical protein